ncbi:MAG: vWA domain-containing protein [Brevinema sp.]
MLFVNLSQAPFILLIFLFGLGAIIGTILRKKRIIRFFFSPNQQKLLRQQEIKGIKIIKIISIITALSMIALALLDPRGTSLTSDVQLNGSDIVLTFDLSRSMDAEDENPTRLELAKQLSEQLLDSLVGNRVGLVGFAADATRLLPLTTDLSAVSLFIKDFDTRMFSSQSTDIGKALQESVDTFSEEALTHKTIIIFTDGENLDGDVDDAIDTIKKQGINIFFIGMGTDQGSFVPAFDDKGQKIGYITDRKKQIISKLDNDFLKKIADKANGHYLKGSRSIVSKLITQINNFEKNPFGANTQNFLEPKFRIFIIVALLGLLIFLFTPEQKRRSLIIILLLSIAPPAFSFRSEREGYVNYNKQEFSTALRFYQRSLIKNPKNEKAKFGEGAALYKLERGDRAVNSFTSLTNSSNPKIREKVLFNVANAHVLAKNTDEAKNIYKKILKEYPVDSKIYKKALNNYLYLMVQESQTPQQKQDNNQEQEQKQEQQNTASNTNNQNNQDSQTNENQNNQEKKEQQEKQQKESNQDQTPSKSISGDDVENLLGVAEEEERKNMKRQYNRKKAGLFEKNKW